jgi:(S)-ureidoglycine aminohydrolase
MRPFLLFLILAFAAPAAFPQAIASKVYSWSNSPVVKHTGYEVRTIIEGTTRDFSNVTVQGVTLYANQPSQPAQQLEEEALLIIKTGQLTLTIGNKTKILGPGSVALIMPGDDHRLENKTADPLTYYVMRLTSNQMPDVDINKMAGGSFWVDWNEVPYTPHSKGGIRRMFDTGTVMTERFEMHVTTLNPGLWSHPPHQHRAAEILIMMENTAEEQIDGEMHSANAGDLIFLESNVPHAIKNTAQKPCTYFAFQFE